MHKITPIVIHINGWRITKDMIYNNQWDYFVSSYFLTTKCIRRGEKYSLESCLMYYLKECKLKDKLYGR